MKNIFLLTIISSFALYASANKAPIDSTEAKTVATNYFEHIAPCKSLAIRNVYKNYYNDTLTFYAVNFLSGGYVVVSADNATIPILAYSTSNNYNQNSDNLAFVNWMNKYSKQIINAKLVEFTNEKTIAKWDSIKNKQFRNKNREVLTPLIQAHYDQSGFNDCSNNVCGGYNKYVPVTNQNCGCYEGCNDNGSHITWDYNCLTGCMATAMAQVIDYWEFVDINGYNIYDWANMSNELNINSSDKEIFAISHLLADCGYFSDMGYCTWFNDLIDEHCQSFASPSEARSAFRNIGYKKADVKRRENITNVFRWKKLIKDDLDENRPVYILP